MNKMMQTLCATSALALMSSMAFAKLPAPSDEAKAKAAEAAAKAAWAGKVDAFKLCQSQDKVAAYYRNAPAASAPKPVATAVAGAAPSGACVDPGSFVYVPAGAAGSATAATAAPAATAAASAADPAKKP